MVKRFICLQHKHKLLGNSALGHVSPMYFWNGIKPNDRTRCLTQGTAWFAVRMLQPNLPPEHLSPPYVPARRRCGVCVCCRAPGGCPTASAAVGCVPGCEHTLVRQEFAVMSGRARGRRGAAPAPRPLICVHSGVTPTLASVGAGLRLSIGATWVACVVE